MYCYYQEREKVLEDGQVRGKDVPCWRWRCQGGIVRVFIFVVLYVMWCFCDVMWWYVLCGGSCGGMCYVVVHGVLWCYVLCGVMGQACCGMLPPLPRPPHFRLWSAEYRVSV